MYNDKFSDLMEKINATAKSMNFTNGISWARNAFENKKLSQLEYNNYEKCHVLRNLIAHGSACDIQISEDTMQIATAFYAAITAKPIETPKLADGSTPVQKPQYSRKKTPIRVGDYVIMVRNEKRYWSNFSTTPEETDRESRQFTPGFVFRVEDKNLNLYSLTASNGDYAERRWMMAHSDCAYIFRTEQD